MKKKFPFQTKTHYDGYIPASGISTSEDPQKKKRRNCPCRPQGKAILEAVAGLLRGRSGALPFHSKEEGSVPT